MFKNINNGIYMQTITKEICPLTEQRIIIGQGQRSIQ